MESLLRKAREAREFLTPVLKNSKFLTEGVLTPEEFVRAGDNLTFKCPTWRWESGDARHSKPYLPEHKQYLCTRGVPCRARVSVMEAEYAKTTASAAEALEGDDESAGGGGGGGSEGADWTVLSDGDEKKKKTAQSEASAAPAGGASKPQEGEKDADGSDSDSDSDYLDMEAFEDETLLQDDAAALPAATGGPGNAARGNSGKSSQGGGGGGNIEKTRTYDLSITYDNYYKTPRVWLFGYDRHGNPLAAEQIFEDIAEDYRKRTVTIDPHPHLHDMMHASIHPCKHAAVMKKIVGAMLSSAEASAAEELEASDAAADTLTGSSASESKGGISVDSYLFIFLKFIQSVIPTIDYDFTMSVSFNLGGGGEGGAGAKQ